MKVRWCRKWRGKIHLEFHFSEWNLISKLRNFSWHSGSACLLLLVIWSKVVQHAFLAAMYLYVVLKHKELSFPAELHLCVLESRVMLPVLQFISDSSLLQTVLQHNGHAGACVVPNEKLAAQLQWNPLGLHISCNIKIIFPGNYWNEITNLDQWHCCLER